MYSHLSTSTEGSTVTMEVKLSNKIRYGFIILVIVLLLGLPIGDGIVNGAIEALLIISSIFSIFVFSVFKVELSNLHLPKDKRSIAASFSIFSILGKKFNTIEEKDLEKIILERRLVGRAGSIQKNIVSSLMFKYKNEDNHRQLLTARSNICYQIGETIRGHMNVDFELAFLKYPFNVGDDNSSKINANSGENNDFIVGFPGKIIENKNTLGLTFGDKHRLNGIMFLIISTGLGLFILSRPLFGIGPLMESELDRNALYMVSGLIFLFALYKFITGYKLIYVELSENFVSVGYNLFGYKSTRSLPIDKIQYVTFTDDLYGFYSFVVISEQDMIVEGIIKNKEKLPLAKSYIIHQIEKRL